MKITWKNDDNLKMKMKKSKDSLKNEDDLKKEDELNSEEI